MKRNFGLLLHCATLEVAYGKADSSEAETLVNKMKREGRRNKPYDDSYGQSKLSKSKVCTIWKL
jgi:hypothetical protein